MTTTCKSTRYVDWEPTMEEMQANWKVETLKRRVRALEAKHRELGFECEPQKEQSRYNDVRRAAALRDEHVPCKEVQKSMKCDRNPNSLRKRVLRYFKTFYNGKFGVDTEQNDLRKVHSLKSKNASIPWTSVIEKLT